MTPITPLRFLKKMSPSLVIYGAIFLFISLKRPPLFIELLMIALVIWGLLRAFRQTWFQLYLELLDELARSQRLSPQQVALRTGFPVEHFTYDPQGSLVYTKKNRKQLHQIVAHLRQPIKES